MPRKSLIALSLSGISALILSTASCEKASAQEVVSVPDCMHKCSEMRIGILDAMKVLGKAQESDSKDTVEITDSLGKEMALLGKRIDIIYEILSILHPNHADDLLSFSRTVEKAYKEKEAKSKIQTKP